MFTFSMFPRNLAEMEEPRMATHENLLATVNALELAKLSRPDAWQTMPYKNRHGIWGTFVRFWNGGLYHMISVHNCSSLLTPSKLAYLIKGIESIDEFRFGIYANRKDVPGFYATAKSTHMLDGSVDHWFMIARSPEKNYVQILQNKRFLSEEEKDLIPYLESARCTMSYFLDQGNHNLSVKTELRA